MESNLKYDFVLEEKIFTDEQKEFLRENHENLFKFKHEREIAEKEKMEYEEKNRKVHFFLDQEDLAWNNLEPFINKTKEYLDRCNDIMKANGLEEDDFPNEKAMHEINLLAESMLEESSKYSEDLTYNLETRKELASMFKDDSIKNDRNSMFEETENEFKSDLAKRFK